MVTDKLKMSGYEKFISVTKQLIKGKQATNGLYYIHGVSHIMFTGLGLR